MENLPHPHQPLAFIKFTSQLAFGASGAKQATGTCCQEWVFTLHASNKWICVLASRLGHCPTPFHFLFLDVRMSWPPCANVSKWATQSLPCVLPSHDSTKNFTIFPTWRDFFVTRKLLLCKFMTIFRIFRVSTQIEKWIELLGFAKLAGSYTCNGCVDIKNYSCCTSSYTKLSPGPRIGISQMKRQKK